VELIAAEGVVDDAVLKALAATDRARYVPEDALDIAYLDRPVPIPEGQTTSQPSLIARMVAAARPPEGGRVLEVGTGYGYQTAVLARLVGERGRVWSIERFETLARRARVNLAADGVTNAEVVVGDGRLGYPQGAPYDAIVVSAAAAEVPPALAEQLSEGGALVIPLRRAGSDDVWVYVKRAGRLEAERLLTPARFVPLVPGEQAR
jgi:protein-L-isoaspartate(D-aspartate) O-methyltransferase